MNSEAYFPAEWHPQCGIQLTWPHADTDWNDCLDEISETFLQLAKAIVGHEHLLVVTPETWNVRVRLSERLTAEEMHRVIFCCCDTNDTWARDHGAISLLRPTPDGDVPELLNFKFNGWGEKFPSDLDDDITSMIAGQGLFHVPLTDYSDFVLEGGAIETDGADTLFTTSMCLLAPHRNQPLTQAELESRLKTMLHVERVVWIDHGSLLGDDTDGHIDTIVRCAPKDTLLYVGCDDPSDPQYADFQALKHQLQSVRTIDGRPYRLLRLPMPDPLYDNGTRLPATYANFLVINGAVIVPTYGQPAKDDMAATTISSAFPDREIIRIDATTVIRQHGSLHCLTMQYPDGVLVKPNPVNI